MLSRMVNLTDMLVLASIAPLLLRAAAWYGMPWGAWACAVLKMISKESKASIRFILNEGYYLENACGKVFYNS
jgi:hypothetical protein